MSSPSLPLSLSSDVSSPSSVPLPLDKLLANFSARFRLSSRLAAFLALSSLSSLCGALLSLDLPLGVALVRDYWLARSRYTSIAAQGASRQ